MTDRGGFSAWRWPIVAVVLGVLVVYAFLAAVNRFVAAGERVAAAPADSDSIRPVKPMSS